MKKLNQFLALLLIVPTLLITSCKDDETIDANSYETLKAHLLDNDMDLDHIIKYHDAEKDADIKFVTGAPADDALDGFLAKYHIIDIRSAASFGEGHIEGAVNIPPADGDLSGVIAEAAKAEKQILVVCYTGQTACFVTSCLRLLGHRNAQALKWGMSGWNGDFDSWSGKIGNIAETSENWSVAAAPQNGVYEAPVITLNATDGASILAAQVESVLKAGFKGVNPDEALNNPSDFFINNYFSETDYTGFGHIDGAYRINPLLISDNSNTSLDPAAKVVTYCYTGQTSGVITAYLRVLGYDAYSLKFGMNGLYNSNSAWSSNQWGGDSKSKSLPTVK